MPGGANDEWELEPIRAPQELVPPADRWTSAEWARIRKGVEPRDEDDRWVVVIENNRLFLHRSWSGAGIYEAEFDELSDGSWAIVDAIVESDEETYRPEADAVEASKLAALVDVLLLGRRPSLSRSGRDFRRHR
jgi:hypothetical protein